MSSTLLSIRLYWCVSVCVCLCRCRTQISTRLGCHFECNGMNCSPLHKAIKPKRMRWRRRGTIHRSSMHVRDSNKWLKENCRDWTRESVYAIICEFAYSILSSCARRTLFKCRKSLTLSFIYCTFSILKFLITITCDGNTIDVQRARFRSKSADSTDSSLIAVAKMDADECKYSFHAIKNPGWTLAVDLGLFIVWQDFIFIFRILCPLLNELKRRK